MALSLNIFPLSISVSLYLLGFVFPGAGLLSLLLPLPMKAWTNRSSQGQRSTVLGLYQEVLLTLFTVCFCVYKSCIGLFSRARQHCFCLGVCVCVCACLLVCVRMHLCVCVQITNSFLYICVCVCVCDIVHVLVGVSVSTQLWASAVVSRTLSRTNKHRTASALCPPTASAHPVESIAWQRFIYYSWKAARALRVCVRTSISDRLCRLLQQLFVAQSTALWTFSNTLGQVEYMYAHSPPHQNRNQSRSACQFWQHNLLNVFLVNKGRGKWWKIGSGGFIR